MAKKPAPMMTIGRLPPPTAPNTTSLKPTTVNPQPSHSPCRTVFVVCHHGDFSGTGTSCLNRDLTIRGPRRDLSGWGICAEVAGELLNFLVDLDPGVAAQAVRQAGGLQLVADRRALVYVTGRSCLLGAGQKLIDFSPVVATHHDREPRRHTSKYHESLASAVRVVRRCSRPRSWTGHCPAVMKGQRCGENLPGG